MSDPATSTEAAFELAAQSFFIGGGEQQELFDRAEDLFCQNAQEYGDADIPRNPEFTLSTFKKNRPEAYNLVVWMSLQFFPLREMARIAQASTNTVAAVRDEVESSQDVETVRSKLATSMRSLSRLTVERLTEVLQNRDQSELDEGKLGNLLKHTVQMSELLSGNATDRIDWRPDDRESVSYEDYVKQAIPLEAENHPAGRKGALRDGPGRSDPLGLPGSSGPIEEAEEVPNDGGMD